MAEITGFWMASNETIHAAGCAHAIKLRVLFDAPTIEYAKKYADEPRNVRVAPCAKKAVAKKRKTFNPGPGDGNCFHCGTNGEAHARIGGFPVYCPEPVR